MSENIRDLMIIGAGPAGLMAAIRGASLGLKVVVIDKKKDITKVTRACSAQFVLDKDYEDETIQVKNHKIIFTKNRFELPYTGKAINMISNNLISPGGHKVHLAHPGKRPFAVKFDKGQLLKELRKRCEELGVEMHFATIARGGEDQGDKVCVQVKCDNQLESIAAKKLIIAEGANAKVTGLFGFNEGRKLFGMPLVECFTLVDTEGFEPQSWNQFYGDVYHPFAEVMVGQSIYGLDAVDVTIMGMKDMRPNLLFNKLVKESPLSKNFAHAKIVDKKGCAVRSYASLIKPYKGNVLVIGDSAAHVEVIVQGALMCGYRAAQAIERELSEKEGFKEYANWWRKAFDFNRMDGIEFVKLYGDLGIKARFTDDEIDYLFSCIEGRRLCGNFSQFEVPKNLWRELLKYKRQIERERPKIFEKMQSIIALQAKGIL